MRDFRPSGPYEGPEAWAFILKNLNLRPAAAAQMLRGPSGEAMGCMKFENPPRAVHCPGGSSIPPAPRPGTTGANRLVGKLQVRPCPARHRV